MKIVVDTCILKLATFPNEDNPAALIVELCIRGLLNWWASPAILDEYSQVLGDEPAFLADIFQAIEICYPITELDIIRHAPDNRFLECALCVNANYLITVNMARGHFDNKRYGPVSVVSPGAFVHMPLVYGLLRSMS